MSQLAGLLGKIGPKLSGLVSGAQQGGQGGGLAKLLQAAADRENAAGPSQRGQSFGQLSGIVGNLGELGGMASSAGGSVRDVLTASSPTKALAGGLRAVGGGMGTAGGAIGGAVGGPAGAAIGSMAGEAVGMKYKFAAAIVESIDKLREWSKGLHNANMQFAEFSGAMARVQADTEAREFVRLQGQGDRRANSAGDLSRAAQGVEDQLAPLEDLWAVIQNKLTSEVMGRLEQILEAIKIKELAEWLLSLTGASDPEGGMDAWVQQLAAEEREARNRRPPGMRQG